MEEILKSTLLEYEKSTFLIDVINHNSKGNYINIRQNIVGNDDVNQLKINFSILSDLISVLDIYRKEFSRVIKNRTELYFSEEKQISVVARYLKGSISVKDLALQFDCSIQIIEQILFNKGIEIVDIIPPEKEIKYRKKRRR